MSKYNCTNESLEAITAGLDLHTTDNVLSICGSGDQPFAILEYAAHVTAIDINPKQIRHAQKQAEKLREGKFTFFKYKKLKPITLLKSRMLSGIMDKEEYLSPEEHTWLVNIHYFKKPGRLEAIRDKLEGINFMEGNVFTKEFKPNSFDKIYLSNAYGFLGYRPTLDGIIRAVKNNGLIYFVRPEIMKHYDENGCTLYVDEELTRKATELTKRDTTSEYWKPTIFRKVT